MIQRKFNELRKNKKMAVQRTHNGIETVRAANQLHFGRSVFIQLVSPILHARNICDFLSHQNFSICFAQKYRGVVMVGEFDVESDRRTDAIFEILRVACNLETIFVQSYLLCRRGILSCAKRKSHQNEIRLIDRFILTSQLIRNSRLQRAFNVIFIVILEVALNIAAYRKINVSFAIDSECRNGFAAAVVAWRREGHFCLALHTFAVSVRRAHEHTYNSVFDGEVFRRLDFHLEFGEFIFGYFNRFLFSLQQ